MRDTAEARTPLRSGSWAGLLLALALCVAGGLVVYHGLPCFLDWRTYQNHHAVPATLRRIRQSQLAYKMPDAQNPDGLPAETLWDLEPGDALPVEPSNPPEANVGWHGHYEYRLVVGQDPWVAAAEPAPKAGSYAFAIDRSGRVYRTEPPAATGAEGLTRLGPPVDEAFWSRERSRMLQSFWRLWLSGAALLACLAFAAWRLLVRRP